MTSRRLGTPMARDEIGGSPKVSFRPTAVARRARFERQTTGTPFSGTVVASGELASLRASVSAWLEPNADERASSATQLIVTELVTNGLEHSCAERVDIEIWRNGKRLKIRVDHAVDEGKATFDLAPRMPDETSSRSRGLAVVSALATSVDRTYERGRLSITASLELAPSRS